MIGDRQGIHVGPNHETRAGPVAHQQADPTVLGDSRLDIEAEFSQPFGQLGRGPLRLETVLGDAVPVPAHADRRLIEIGRPFANGVLTLARQ
jgi:hypothetical protein